MKQSRNQDSDELRANL